jgi:hypothetical protein
MNNSDDPGSQTPTPSSYTKQYRIASYDPDSERHYYVSRLEAGEVEWGRDPLESARLSFDRALAVAKQLEDLFPREYTYLEDITDGRRMLVTMLV